MLDTVNAMTMASLKASVAARVPVMLVGAPGTGKTATVHQLGKDMGYKVLTLVGSQMDPTDIVGLPKGELLGQAEDGQDIYGTVNLSPHWQVRILLEKKIILFLDEFSNTAGATRASMLTMLQNREFPNGQIMPQETIVIGAMNPTSQAADGYELDAPTTNRIFFIPWKTSTQSWCEGMLVAWGNKDASAKELSWRKKIVNFINENPAQLHQEGTDLNTKEVFGVNMQDESEAEVFRYAWASRRSWDNLSRVLTNAPDDTSIQDMIAQGLVGYSAAAKFRDWLRRNDNIRYQDVLADPDILDWEKTTPNDLALLFRSITDGLEEENYAQALNVFIRASQEGRAAEAGTYVFDVLKFLNSGKIADPANVKKFKGLANTMVTHYRSVSSKANSK